jgi:hypothetical protein
MADGGPGAISAALPQPANSSVPVTLRVTPALKRRRERSTKEGACLALAGG